MGKYVINRGSVQETLILPLYGKKFAHELYPDLFPSKESARIISKIDYHPIKMSKLKTKVGAIMAGTRQFDLATVCKEYISRYPSASVVNMGCGLDTTFYQIDNGIVTCYNIDFEDVITIRKDLIPPKEREQNIACDIMDYSWFDSIDYKKENGVVFFGSGLFYYFKKKDVKDLLINMAGRFPGGKIVFDATNAKGIKKMAKTWLSPAQMSEVGLYFSLEDKKEIEEWSDKFASVVQKSYMSGYRPLQKRYGIIVNAIFRYADRKNMGQIIEIEFAP